MNLGVFPFLYERMDCCQKLMEFKPNKQTKSEKQSIEKSRIQHYSYFLTSERNLFIEENNEFSEIFLLFLLNQGSSISTAMNISMFCLNLWDS